MHLALRPLPRGSGVRFVDEASLDSLPAPYHSLVRTHVLEKAHLGPLTGSPIDDVEIALLSGRAHLKHTEGRAIFARPATAPSAKGSSRDAANSWSPITPSPCGWKRGLWAR